MKKTILFVIMAMLMMTVVNAQTETHMTFDQKSGESQVFTKLEIKGHVWGEGIKPTAKVETQFSNDGKVKWQQNAVTFGNGMPWYASAEHEWSGFEEQSMKFEGDTMYNQKYTAKTLCPPWSTKFAFGEVVVMTKRVLLLLES